MDLEHERWEKKVFKEVPGTGMEAIKKEHVYGASWKSGNRCFKFL
jgi:hypothetical protein